MSPADNAALVAPKLGDVLRYAKTPDGFLPGHRIELLTGGGPAYPSMRHAIDDATTTVHLETYIFAEDDVGCSFRDALCAAATRGVAVRVLVDGFGSLSLSDEFLASLSEQGVEVAVFRPPVRHWSSRRLYRRDHRKLLLVDGRVGFTGGLNIGREYAPREAGGDGWHDLHMRVEGPALATMESSFRTMWEAAGGARYRALPRTSLESVAHPATEWASVVCSDESGRRSAIRRRLLHAIAQASASVRIWSAYFVPDRALRAELAKAVSRGLEVEVIVPARSDVRWVQWAGEYLYAELLRKGVKVHRWHDSHMHAKSVVIDGAWCSVGSYNLDYISLFMNHELVVEVVGRETGGALERQYELDRQRCETLTMPSWEHRSWLARARSRVAFQVRRWL